MAGSGALPTSSASDGLDIDPGRDTMAGCEAQQSEPFGSSTASSGRERGASPLPSQPAPEQQ
eukprot:7646272-Karenia_brevis.AAC.1